MTTYAGSLEEHVAEEQFPDLARQEVERRELVEQIATALSELPRAEQALAAWQREMDSTQPMDWRRSYDLARQVKSIRNRITRLERLQQTVYGEEA